MKKLKHYYKDKSKMFAGLAMALTFCLAGCSDDDRVEAPLPDNSRVVLTTSSIWCGNGELYAKYYVLGSGEPLRACWTPDIESDSVVIKLRGKQITIPKSDFKRVSDGR